MFVPKINHVLSLARECAERSDRSVCLLDTSMWFKAPFKEGEQERAAAGICSRKHPSFWFFKSVVSQSINQSVTFKHRKLLQYALF
jgi:hypothetical protein